MNSTHSWIRRALTLGCLAAAAPALAVGPDITHQEIQDTTRYGPVNNVYAYAWGSRTCNLGDGSLSWINGGTPALAMNAYRLFDGQLLQIGLGNCKHGCCVANGSGCGLQCSSTGFGLRPGCLDVYSAGFNGGQTRLGPRSGINPYDGTFAPIASGSGDAIWRRVQIPITQMNETNFPGALYFAEGVYVCAEENPPEQLNNATYRRATVANTGASPTYAWSLTGASMTGIPAIYAWRDHGLGAGMPDDSVKVVIADVPGEGRYFVAGKVRQVSDDRWRYDYAVFNLNSHISAASFSVGIRPGAIVTDIGFHAPAYHSGEVYSNAAWTGSKLNNRVQWVAPETFAVNPNTNALRWGTMYNFWFTTDVAPEPTLREARIGLFRPYSAPSIAAAGLPAPGNPCEDCPADHNCNGQVSVQDIFDFLADYFAQAAPADFNGVGGVTIDDLFAFLGKFFSC